MRMLCSIRNRYPILSLLPTIPLLCSSFFFFNDTATTEIYTLSLHDALPIYLSLTFRRRIFLPSASSDRFSLILSMIGMTAGRSEEHTSELQSRLHLVCRLLLEKKNTSGSRMR